ncbi:CHASE2 domain-containing protein [Phormidium sp. CCY1219]|uniref:CHASE2 domain-containing protein n=1 Tax=Phormidium sp. CCY1219 TaxID=2886104 RepID=UPI002D1F08C8|nr:CHASE2 domain-containing protein [Phormidium sp. CCY1219]MEB3827526.1 CHASE2 domain-containing protein [Phormidium sp. CCY1219]
MSTEPVKPPPKWWAIFQLFFRQGRGLLVTCSSVAGFVLLVRFLGLLQSLEWGAYDQMFRWRPQQPIDECCLIIGIDESDLRKLQTWPIPDRVMAELIETVHALNPRAIGLDLFRDLPVQPGHEQLNQVFANTPNLIGIEKLADRESLGVPPPTVLAERNAVGFNNVAIDSDGKVRRNLIYWRTENGTIHRSLALQLAFLYLDEEGIKLETLKHHPGHFKLGRSIFRPFESYDGAYVRADDGGYQLLTNFRSPAENRESPSVGFRTVSMAEVLEGKVPPAWVRDRVVLIGSIAPSLKDFFYIPYSGRWIEPPKKVFGVELHALFVSQILNAALDGRPPSIQVWPEAMEWLWIFLWSWVGASLSWNWRSPLRFTFYLLLSCGSLTGFCYLLFLLGWWIPLIPPLITLGGSAVGITGYIAYREEKLKRAFAESKEFLHQIINTIPDPIFVQDKNHRWVVLNEAYCQFIGYPLEYLLHQSAANLFPSEEAEIFWQQNEQVFQTGLPIENEEKFTDARGITHFIATKRSLHKDPAGNVFLVGAIRDITERKRMEEELKRTAAELASSYEELKLSENRLRHQAYHDTLTGLPNRTLFYERLRQALEWAAVNQQQVAILFLDLDGFKTINDTQGHECGDLLLQDVANRLSACLRGSDTVARLGGDEFTVILPAIPRKQDALRVAHKIMSTLSAPFVLHEREIHVTTSIGISLYPLDGEDLEGLINKADAAMYRAKESGKNQVKFS